MAFHHTPDSIQRSREAQRLRHAGSIEAMRAAEEPVELVAAFRCGCGAEVVTHIGPAECSSCWARRVETKDVAESGVNKPPTKGTENE